MMRLLFAAAGALLTLAAVPAAAMPCGELTVVAQRGWRIVAATSVAADQRWTDDQGVAHDPVGVPVCRVRAVIGRETGVELWLPPRERWNGRFLQAGVGGEAGTYDYADLVRGVRRGYAAASTDAGHRLADRDWAYRRPDRRVDFAWRANHRLAVGAKRLVRRTYGAAATHAFFIGCSGGGREALKEVQRFPRDFDGVVAGGAGPDQFAVSLRLLWSQYVVAPRIAPFMRDADWALVAHAAINRCDAGDGVRDGMIADPRRCDFRPAMIACSSGQSQGCLSADQVAAATLLYQPLVDEAGRAIDAGLYPGVRVTMTPRSAFAYSLFGRVAHDAADWDPAGLDIARDLALARRAWPGLTNDRTDLHAFRDAGGKLIYYHGWMDPWILAQQPIAWFERVRRDTPGADGFARLFMVEGMGHCRGGAGPDQFGGAGADAPIVDADHDLLAALERWVEQGRAPERIVAAQVVVGRTVRTRPLCAWPAQPRYRAGDADAAASFDCLTGDPAP